MVAATPIGNLSPLSSKHSHEEESSKDTSIEESLHSSISKGDDATQVPSSIDMKDLMAKFNKLQKEFDLDKVRHQELNDKFYSDIKSVKADVDILKSTSSQLMDDISHVKYNASDANEKIVVLRTYLDDKVDDFVNSFETSLTEVKNHEEENSSSIKNIIKTQKNLENTVENTRKITNLLLKTITCWYQTNWLIKKISRNSWTRFQDLIKT